MALRGEMVPRRRRALPHALPLEPPARPQGRLYVFWYDNRDGAGHFFSSVSSDGGKTFAPNRLVSAPAFPFDTFQYSSGWLGDYFEPALAGGEIYALWGDGREADPSHAFLANARPP